MITVFVAPPVSGVACTSTSVTVEGNLEEIKVDAGSRHSHLIHARAFTAIFTRNRRRISSPDQSVVEDLEGQIPLSSLRCVASPHASKIAPRTSPDSKRRVARSRNAGENTYTGLSKHALWLLTLKGDDVARDEELEVGAGPLEKVLDVSPGRQLVFLFHLFGAAGLVLGHTHLEVGL